jgi:Na+-transporting methylmalonyl-CoA/oxaloacetate decarboxylase gamma subunit
MQRFLSILKNFILCIGKVENKVVKIFLDTVSVPDNVSHTSPVQNCRYKGLLQCMSKFINIDTCVWL